MPYWRKQWRADIVFGHCKQTPVLRMHLLMKHLKQSPCRNMMQHLRDWSAARSISPRQYKLQHNCYLWLTPLQIVPMQLFNCQPQTVAMFLSPMLQLLDWSDSFHFELHN
jgi:hypothetical protein